MHDEEQCNDTIFILHREIEWKNDENNGLRKTVHELLHMVGLAENAFASAHTLVPPAGPPAQLAKYLADWAAALRRTRSHYGEISNAH